MLVTSSEGPGRDWARATAWVIKEFFRILGRTFLVFRRDPLWYFPLLKSWLYRTETWFNAIHIKEPLHEFLLSLSFIEHRDRLQLVRIWVHPLATSCCYGQERNISIKNMPQLRLITRKRKYIRSVASLCEQYGVRRLGVRREILKFLAAKSYCTFSLNRLPYPR